MDTDRWRQLNSMFLEAYELPKEQRKEFVENACADDPSLRQELELLIYEAECEEDGPLCGAAELNAHDVVSHRKLQDPVIGTTIGQFEIKQHLGRGGFGDVYLGVRKDDFIQKAAIKLLRADHQTNEQLLRRFEIERQVLADLNHNNIARLIDGGTTDLGRPYLVMEYVAGDTITSFCDEKNFNTVQRLELFIQIGRAVAHAHQYGLIHRDLKPANILVSRDGVPKLVDFGIVRLTDLRNQPDVLTLTKTGMLPLTPEYASPEQICGEKVGLPSDVYSLGVVLYELLAGARPYQFESHSPSEIERYVCQVSPPPPSVMILRNTASAMAESHPSTKDRLQNENRRRLSRALRGDLDNIVLKAIRKEPGRRYRSAAEVCDDVQRHLDGLPVEARADSLAYRASSFVRRNRVTSAACVCILLALISGALISMTGWHRASMLAEKFRSQLYVSDMQVGFDAYRHGQLDEAMNIVARHDGFNGNVNRFELKLLKQLARPTAPLAMKGHRGSVNELALISGTQRLVSVGDDSIIRLWDTESGELIRSFGTIGEPIYSVAVSPDGKYVATGNQSVTLWDLEVGKRVRDLGSFSSNAESLAFSPDGKQLAIGIRYTGLTVVSVADGSIVHNLPGTSRYWNLAYLPNGKLIVTDKDGGGGGILLLRNAKFTKTRRYIAKSDGTIAPRIIFVDLMAVSHDYRWVAASTQRDGWITIFDVATTNVVATLASQGDGIRSLCFSPDGSYLAAGHEDGKVRIWNFRALSPKLSPKNGERTAIANLSDAKQVLQTDSSTIHSLVFVNNDRLAIGGSNGNVELWTIRQGAHQKSVLAIGEMAVSLHGRIAYIDKKWHLWINERKGFDDWRPLLNEYEYLFVAISPDGTYLLARRRNNVIDLIDIASNEVIHSFQFSETQINDICISPSGRFFASTGNSGHVTIWKTSDRSLFHQLDLEDGGWTVAFSPDDKYIPVGGQFFGVYIFNVADGSLRDRISMDSTVRSVTWSDDSQWLASGENNGTIFLYNIKKRRHSRLLGHQNAVFSLAFSRDGQTLVSGGNDSTIRLWNVATQRPMGILDQTNVPSRVSYLSFSQDGNQLFAARWGKSDQGGIFVWETVP